MSTELFATKHEHLQRDYSDGSEKFVDSCTLVALEIADALKAEGLTPRLLHIQGEAIDTHGKRATLMPTPFEGRVQWGSHIICEAEGVVYDPMLQSPLPLEEYLTTAFNQVVELEDCSSILDN